MTYFEDNYVILTWDCLNQIKETHKLKEGNNYIIEMVPDACEREVTELRELFIKKFNINPIVINHPIKIYEVETTYNETYTN